jgi:hypothetical protein
VPTPSYKNILALGITREKARMDEGKDEYSLRTAADTELCFL